VGAGQGLDFLAVGHVTVDVSADGDVAVGGAASYAATTAAALGRRSGIVTRAAAGYPPDEALPGVLRHIVRSEHSTTFENRYDERGGRQQRVRALAEPIEVSDVPARWRSVGVLHLAPVAHDVPPGLTSAIEAEFVGVTPQGWLRRIAVGQPVEPCPWSAPTELVERADAIVLSEEDVAADSGRLAWLVERVPVVVITNGDEGAHAYSAGGSMHQPAMPARAVDPTGAGDTFAASLFIRLWEGADLRQALRVAAAAAAFGVEHQGIGGLPTRDAIEQRAGA
jgi:sugar/nucleoside kinase (ribokinase family)